MGTNERARFHGGSIGFVFQAFNLLPLLTTADSPLVGRHR